MVKAWESKMEMWVLHDVCTKNIVNSVECQLSQDSESLYVLESL